MEHILADCWAIYFQWLAPISRETAGPLKWRKTLKLRKFPRRLTPSHMLTPSARTDCEISNQSKENREYVFYCRILQLWKCWAHPSYFVFCVAYSPNPWTFIFFSLTSVDDQSESQTWKHLQNLAVEPPYKWSVEFVGGNNHVPRTVQIFPTSTWDGIDSLPILQMRMWKLLSEF